MSYVYAGYGITFAVLAGYALRVVWRGRALRKVLLIESGETRRPDQGPDSTR